MTNTLKPTVGQRFALIDEPDDIVTVAGPDICNNCDQPADLTFQPADDSYDRFVTGLCCTPLDQYRPID